MLDSLPANWMVCELGDVAKVDWGDTAITKRSYVEDGFPAYSAAGRDGLLPYFDFNCDAVVVSAIGANSGRVFWATGKWSAIKNTMVMLPNSDALSIRFAYYKAQQADFWPISGGAQPFIGLKNARKQKVILPPLAEQQRIAEILTSVDDSIRATEAVIAQAERVKRGLMEDLLTGGLGSAAIARGEVPNDWRSVNFSQAFFVKNDKTKQIQKSKYRAEGDFPIIDQSTQLIAGYSSGEPNEDFPVVIFGDHTRCIKWVDFPFFAGADGTQALYSSEQIIPKFGYYLMQNVDLPNLGYSRHMRELKRASFLIPPNETQRRIVDVLDSLDAEVCSNQQIKNQLQTLKRGLMDDLLTGRVRTV